MNAHVKNTACCITAVVAIAAAVYLVHDHVYVYVPLSGAITDDVVWCDAECARQAETQRRDSFRCVEVGDDRFVCRSERGFGIPLWPEECRHGRCHDCGLQRWCPGLEISRMLDVTPVTYGEIVTLLTGVKGEGFFDIAHADVIDAQEKRISVGFAPEYPPGSGDLVYTAQMVPGATFLTGCGVKDTPHLVTYTDLYVSGNATYAEFWGIHPAWAHSDPRPCDLAETVERTLKIDYDIDLPGYDEFGFQP